MPECAVCLNDLESETLIVSCDKFHRHCAACFMRTLDTLIRYRGQIRSNITCCVCFPVIGFETNYCFQIKEKPKKEATTCWTVQTKKESFKPVLNGFLVLQHMAAVLGKRERFQYASMSASFSFSKWAHCFEPCSDKSVHCGLKCARNVQKVPWCCGSLSDVLLNRTKVGRKCKSCNFFSCFFCGALFTMMNHLESHLAHDCIAVSKQVRNHFAKQTKESSNVLDSDLAIMVEKLFYRGFSTQCHVCMGQFGKDDHCTHVTCPCGTRVCYSCGLPMMKNARDPQLSSSKLYTMEKQHNRVQQFDSVLKLNTESNDGTRWVPFSLSPIHYQMLQDDPSSAALAFSMLEHLCPLLPEQSIHCVMSVILTNVMHVEFFETWVQEATGFRIPDVKAKPKMCIANKALPNLFGGHSLHYCLAKASELLAHEAAQQDKPERTVTKGFFKSLLRHDSFKHIEHFETIETLVHQRVLGSDSTLFYQLYHNGRATCFLSLLILSLACRLNTKPTVNEIQAQRSKIIQAVSTNLSLVQFLQHPRWDHICSNLELLAPLLPQLVLALLPDYLDRLLPCNSFTCNPSKSKKRKSNTDRPNVKKRVVQ